VASASFGADVGEIELVDVTPRVGEGDRVRVRLRRPVGAAHDVRIVGESLGNLRLFTTVSPRPPLSPQVEWLAGESGERVLELPVPDDVDVQGDRLGRFELSYHRDGVSAGYAAVDSLVLDNDRPGVSVLRTSSTLTLSSGAGATGVLELVLDRNDYALPAPAAGSAARWTVEGRTTVFGNGARIDVSPLQATGESACHGNAIAVAAMAELVLDHVELRADVARDRCGLDNAGRLELRRSTLTNLQPGAGYSLRSSGELRLSRSTLARFGNSPARGTLLVSAGTAELLDSTVAAPSQPWLIGQGSTEAVRIDGGTLSVRRSTVAGLPAVSALAGVSAAMSGSVLFERHDTMIGTPPPYQRAPCTAPAITSAGGNLFAASYRGGSVASLQASGCIQPLAGERFVDENWSGLQSVLPVDPTPPAASLAFDAAGTCTGVDLHGRPRAQGSACDSGALEAGINPYRGIWAPARDGHGVDLHTFGSQLFLLWYTYGDDGQPTAYQALAPFSAPQWRATLQQSRREANGNIVTSDVGEIGIDFDNNTEATLRWRFNGRSERTERMQAFLFDGDAPKVEVTGTWFPPAESGNGASIVRRGEVTAAVLYYYDASGTLRWALGTGTAADAVEVDLLSFTGFCPDCDVAQMPVHAQRAGRALLHFLTPRRARVDSDISYPGAAGGRWLRERADFIPINDPVDNGHTLP
jgi:hypothetical protein